VVLEKIFFNIFLVFLHFCYYLPLEMTNGHHMNKSESPSPKDDLDQVWLKLVQWFWRRRFFFFVFSVYFYIFAIISPWKWPMVIKRTNLNPLLPRMIWTKFGWNWPCGSGEEDFFCIFSVFLHFYYYLPLEMTNGHHMNKSKSPSPKDDLGQVWLKLAQCFWRRRF
jgi:hypothetical protein